MAAPARPVAQQLAAYQTWLERQPVSTRTRQAYATNVGRFCGWLAAIPFEYGDPLVETHARDYAVRDFKAHLKTVGRAAPSSVNLALAAVDHFYRFLGLGPAQVRREQLPAQAPRALDSDEQRRLLRAAERTPVVRDRAIVRLLFYAGLRLGECAALDLDDLRLSARKGHVVVRSGKGDAYREVPLHHDARTALGEWLAQRSARFPHSGEKALWLSRLGRRLSARSIDAVVRQLGRDVGIDLSPHDLRHTCFTNLVRAGVDLVLVAELAGHKRLETTRRYALPSAADRTDAVNRVHIDY